MTFNGPEGCVGPVQDTEDKSVVRITYPQGVLFENEAGGSIGGTITVKEHETQREFDPYSFSLKCNTAPPSVTGQAVLVSSSNSQHYFVCFYLPTTELSEPSHSPDTHSIIIEGPNVQTFGPGTVTELTALSQSRPSDLAQLTAGGSFSGTASGYTAFYYDTGRTMVEGENLSWNIYLRDSGGLTSRKMTASTIVRPANMTVSGETLLTTNDGENTAILTASVDDGTVSTWAWENSDNTIATVSNNNGTATITALSGGETTITIRANLTDGRIVTVTKTIRVLDINIDASSPHDFIKGQADVALSTTKPDFATLSCQSSNTAVATVNASGQVTAVAKGSTTITASASYGGKTVSKTHTIYVHEVTISGGNEIFVGGSSITLTATVTPPDGRSQLTTGITYQWISSSTTTATATSGAASSTIAPLAGGSATITLKVTHNSQTITAATKTVSVYQLSISGSTLYKKSQSDTLTASLKCGSTPYSGTGISYEWTSGTQATATIASATGALSTQAGGSTTITVTAKKNGTTIATATKTIYVIEVGGIKSFIVGDIFGHSLEPVPAQDEVSGTITYAWRSLGTSYATVDESSGNISPRAKSSSTTIRLNATCGTETLSIDTPITVSELKFSPSIASTLEIAGGEKPKFRYYFDPELPEQPTAISCKAMTGSHKNSVKSRKTTSGTNNYLSIYLDPINVLSDGETHNVYIQFKFSPSITTSMSLTTVKYVSCHEVSINNLSDYLENLPANDSASPYSLKVTGLTASNYTSLNSTIIEKGKYVDLYETTLPVPSNKNLSFCFQNNTYLVIAPKAIPVGVTQMAGCFNGCTNLVSAPETIPNTVTNINTCFCYTKITTPPPLPDSVTNVNSCFKGCSLLQSAPNIPNTVTDIAGCFSGCTSLSGNVNIYTTNITYSGAFSNVFKDCPSSIRVFVKNSTVKNALADANAGVTASQIYDTL